MKNVLKPLLLLLLVMNAHAQSKFSTGLSSSIDMCRISYVSGNDRGVADFYNQPGLGYQVGVKLKYDATKVFSMITGITFVSHELRSGKIELNSLNPSDPMVPESYQQNETIKSLQLPVLSSFYFGNKLKIGFSFGPAYNYWYRIDYRGYGYWPNETKEYLNTTKLNPGIHFISAIAGVGGEYNFRNLSVRMEPSFTCQLFCINDETMNNNRLWSVGLALSGYYKF